MFNGVSIFRSLSQALFIRWNIWGKNARWFCLLPLMVFLTRHIAPVTHEALLAAIFGGVVIGIGIGPVFLGNGSTGGTALAAKIINKYTGLTLGTCLAMMDGLIVLAAMTVLGLKKDCTL